MFDISLTEIIMVCIASLTTLGVKGSVEMLGKIKKFFANIQKSARDYLSYLDGTDSEGPDLGDNILESIVDMDGNLQKRYDLSKIIPEIKKSKNE